MNSYFLIFSVAVGIVCIILGISIYKKDSLETMIDKSECEEEKKKILERLEHLRKYITYLDEKHQQLVIDDIQYKSELFEVIKSLNEIVVDMYDLHLLDDALEE